MSMLIRDEDSSSQHSDQRYDLQAILLKTANKFLRSAKNTVPADLLRSMQDTYAELVDSQQRIGEYMEYLLYAMLNHIDKLQQTSSMSVVQEDYEVLEGAVQKSQAEVRKHIRIEQQLKIYMDGLEERVEEYEKKLAVEEDKYSKLFETMREVEEERKDLQRRLSRVEASVERSNKPTSSNYTTITDQLGKEYLAGRKSRATSKSKQIIDKVHDRRKMSNKQDSKQVNFTNKNMRFVEGSIHINLSNNIVVSKKNSYDQHIKPQPASHQNSIKELAKTLNMKQQHAPQYDRRPIRKISKHKTENSEGVDRKKDYRSNSVCN